jgi:poly(3-hydroxybutyrate) depolymerase
MKIPVLVLLVASALCAGEASAAHTISIDPADCRTDRLFASGFGEDGDRSVGLLTRQFGGREYFLVVPPGYRPNRQHPLLLALHGTGGDAAGARANALAIAQSWQGIARSSGLIVAAPIGTSQHGSWNPAVDAIYLDALQGQLSSEYQIDIRRRYLWGFSSGGHFGHAYVLARTDQFAAYAIAAGLLRVVACDAASCPGYLAAVPRRIPLDISSNINDPGIPISEISADEGRFLDAGWTRGVDLWVRGLNGQGHNYAQTQLSDSWNTACRFGVVPDSE